jgi:methyl coenzyme M reductase subunit D
MHETFRDKVNSEDSWANCVINSIYVIMVVLQDDLFAKHESIPFILLISLGKFGKVADTATSYLKSYFQDFDRNDRRLVENTFRMIKNENFYKIDWP